MKPWYLEVCVWYGVHVGQLGTDMVILLLQVLHRPLLKLLVVIPIVANDKTEVKAAAEVKEVVVSAFVQELS